MTDNLHPTLTAWASARDRFTAAGERLAELNISSQYQRPDDAPEVLAYHAAEMALARAADELYLVARRQVSQPTAAEPDIQAGSRGMTTDEIIASYPEAAVRVLIADGLRHVARLDDPALTAGNPRAVTWLRTHARQLLTGYSQSLDEQEGSEIELGFLRVRLSGAHADLRAAKAEIRRAWQEVHRLQEAGGAAPGAVSPPDSDRIAALTAALRSLITRIRRVGGYATPEEQGELREAERCVGGER